MKEETTMMFVIWGKAKGKQDCTPSCQGYSYRAADTLNDRAIEIVRAAYYSRYGEYPKYFFPLEAILSLKIVMYYEIPKATDNLTREKMLSQKIRPVISSELNKTLKIVADALKGVAYLDDGQIVSMQASKFYGEVPRIEVCLQTV